MQLCSYSNRACHVYDMLETHTCSTTCHVHDIHHTMGNMRELTNLFTQQVEVEYSSTHTSLQHPTNVLLSHMYHVCTQQVFNFQKIIFFLIPSPSRGLPPVFSSTFDSTSTTLLTCYKMYAYIIICRLYSTRCVPHLHDNLYTFQA